VLSCLQGLQSFSLVLIFLATDTKYLLNSFAISWWLLTGVPSIFKVVTFSELPVLLVSDLSMSQIVLFFI
jgi:hypothetical protein